MELSVKTLKGGGAHPGGSEWRLTHRPGNCRDTSCALRPLCISELLAEIFISLLVLESPL